MTFFDTKRAACLLLPFALACATPASTVKDEEGRTSSLNRPSALHRDAAALRAKQIAHVTYTLWFGLDDSHDDFQGRVVLNFELRDKARELGPELLLDFEGGTLRSMTLNGQTVAEPMSESRYDGHRIHLKAGELHAGANRVELAFSHLYSKTGNGLHRFQDPVDERVYLYSNFEPYNAHRMFPCFDQPDLKASYELTVEAPEDWEVISNTPERETTVVDGRASWAFPPSPIFSTYVFALHAGPYAHWKGDADGIPIRLFARKSLEQYVDHDEWLDITKKGLAFYNAEFGYPYPYAKYDQLIAPDYNGGAMENVAAVTFSEGYVYRSKATQDRHRGRANTILHEMAHMWFGDLVTMRWWNGLWLNESFATFMASRAVDEATKFKGSWQAFFGGKQHAYWQDQTVVTHPIELPVPDTDHAFANFDSITYAKGSAVLKQLRYAIGEDDFREGLQRYFQRFALRNTTLADFIKMLSEASGHHLAEWQKVWLQIAGVNTVRADWACEDNRISRFSLHQSPSELTADLRPHRTKVALYAWPKKGGRSALQKRDSFEVDYAHADTPVAEAIGKACPDFVYPNFEDYDYVKVELDPISLRTAREHLGKFEDPLARQMLWHSLWEMVVDAKLSARDYADMVLAHAGAEKDTQVLGQILAGLISNSPSRSSAYKFLPPELRAGYRQKAEELTFRHLQTAPPGSDLQLVWLAGFRSAAGSPKALEFLAALLDGKRKLSGLKIDTERRWEITHALARAGHADAFELILGELKRDPTDAGKKASIGAEAASPDPKTKDKWLKRILRTGETAGGAHEFKNSELRQAMDSFHALGHEDLIRTTVDPYFESLPKLALTEDERFVQVFTSDMFPALCEAAIIQKTGDFIKEHADLPAAVLKSLRTSRQEEERCVRARALVVKGEAPGEAPAVTPPVLAPKTPLAAPVPAASPAAVPVSVSLPVTAPSPAPASGSPVTVAAPVPAPVPAPIAAPPPAPVKPPAPSSASAPAPAAWDPWKK